MKMLTTFVCTLAVSVLLVGTLPTVQATCTYTINSGNASAKHSVPGARSFFSYSCRPCVREDAEVHVLNMYQMYRTWGGTQQAVTVTIEAAAPTDIKLMLISHEGVHWLITKPADVTIRDIALVSYNKDSAVDLNGLSSPPLTHEDNYITGWESEEMVDFVTNRFGFLSSYTGVYETSAWILTVGECETKRSTNGRTPILTTPKPTSPRLEVIKKKKVAPRYKVAIPMPDEQVKSPKTGQHVIFAVAGIAIAISLGFAWFAGLKKSFAECISKCQEKDCNCLMRNQYEEPDESLERPATPPLATPSAPPLTWTEQEPETPSAPEPVAAPASDPLLPPPAYQDAVNYPRPETPPPTYTSV